MRVVVLILCLLFTSAAHAQCSGGSCGVRSYARGYFYPSTGIQYVPYQVSQVPRVTAVAKPQVQLAPKVSKTQSTISQDELIRQIKLLNARLVTLEASNKRLENMVTQMKFQIDPVQVADFQSSLLMGY